MQQDITTIPELRRTIKKAPAVYVQFRFGCSEKWSRISKAAALDFLSDIPDNADPEKFSMFGGVFGTLEEDGSVSIG